ncbi:hypothetical protein [uncultured Dialister sp.]|jgi:hypothetical protein|uniref:hypothetical protein n=1 Tax=uncultured Dialister sp. TaxID=278064 RepID=UPI00260A0768|nr:hypothetical protein [uncultured Dialister sp.]
MLPSAAAKVGAFKNEMKGAIMIKPYNRPAGEGKQANLAALAEMHPFWCWRTTFAPLGSMSLDFRVAMLPYKSSSFATPEGELCSPFSFWTHKHLKA